MHRLTSYLQNSNIPHNLYVTRGSRLDVRDTGEVYDTVRVYVWARKPAGKPLVSIHHSLIIQHFIIQQFYLTIVPCHMNTVLHFRTLVLQHSFYFISSQLSALVVVSMLYINFLLL